MGFNLFKTKPEEVCEIHGGHGSGGHGNRMLIAMILISLALLIWHVWVYGPSRGVETAGDISGLPVNVGKELWDMLVNKHGIFAELWDVLPYFIAGVLIAGYLRTFKVAVKLQASLRKYGVLSVFLASFVGIITPLCACGTLTTAISLLFAGIPLAPVMALMVTSPLLSPSAYLLTLNDLGSEWTAIRTVSAYSMGVFAGLVAHFMSKRSGFTKKDIFIEGAIIRGDFHDDDYPDERLRCNCRRNFGNRVAVKTGNKFLIFLAKSYEMLWVVGKYVIVGVVVGAVVERYMPGGWIYRFFGQKDPFNIVWITIATIPMFLHQISVSSILFHVKSSLNGTLDSGAALAFLIGGPVTAVPTMVLFWTFFKKRIFVLYMLICISGTLLIAYAFQFFLFVPGVDLGNPLMKGVGFISGGTSAVISKSSPNVRMVMDPSGKGIIATYTNDLEGEGGAVFETSPLRFSNPLAGSYDNRSYILNIARWMEQNSSSALPKQIMVYNLSDNLDDRGSAPLGDAALSHLAKGGFSVKVITRLEAPQVSEKLLAGYGQLWLFAGANTKNRLSDEELRLLSEYNTKGCGILLVAAGAGSSQQVTNLISSRYGVKFAGTVINAQELQVSVASDFLSRTSEIFGKVLKIFRKA